MAEFKFDFRFVEIFYELGALERYLDSFENQLPTIKREEEEKAYARLREKGYDKYPDELRAMDQELYDLTEEVLPRFFRGSILVTLLAIFESGIIDIAKEIRDQQNQTLTINDLRGDFLGRAKKYFNHVLDFPLKTEDENWARIRMFRVLRNAIAHGNGRMENIKNDFEVRKIKNWEKDGIGISISQDNLMFSEQFLRQTYLAVYETLKNLTNRVFKKYPSP